MNFVWFIRHAQSDSNAGLPTKNPEGTRITDLGQYQAEQVAKCFSFAPDRIIVSPYYRTQLTADPLIKRFPAVPVEEWNVQEYTYLMPAKYVGTTGADRRPDVRAYWARNDPQYCDGEGAESFQNFITRVDETLERIKTCSGFTAVFTHGQVIRGLLWRMLYRESEISEKTMEKFFHFREAARVPNASIVKCVVHDDSIWTSGVYSPCSGEKLTF